MARKRPRFRPGLEAIEQRALMSTTPVNLGINLDQPFGNGSGGDVFVDLRNEFNAWGKASKPTVADPKIPLTSDGYPLSDAGTYIDFTGYAPGAYQLSYTGTGTVSFSGPGTLQGTPVKGTDGVTRGIVNLGDSSQGWLGMYFTQIDSSNPIRNFHLIAPGYSPTTTQVFTNDYLNLLKPFSTLRTMDWMLTNQSNDGVWANRTLPTSFSQNNPRGISWEDQIALANESGKDLWINIPDQATPDYVQNLAQLFHAQLDPSLHVYIEYSNEVWNSGFTQNQRVAAKANADPRITAADPAGKIAQEVALQIKADGDIFRQAFGSNAAQVRPVFGGVGAYAYYTTQGLSFLNSLYGDPSQYLYGSAIAPYIDVNGNGGQIRNLDQLFASMNAYFDQYTTQFVTTSAAAAAQFHLPIVGYEGGQSLGTSSGLSANLVTTAQADPRMGQLYTRLTNLWSQNSTAVFNHFSLVGPSGFWGAWPLVPTVNSPGSVRWDALMNAEYGPADSNIDGKVDFADFTILSSNIGLTPAYRSQGDLNGDAQVTLDDLAVLRANLGSTVTPAQALTIAQYGAPTSVALGSSTTLNAGGQSNNGLIYTWTDSASGAATITTTSPTFSFAPTVSGTHTITLKVTNTQGASATGVLTVVASGTVVDGSFENPSLGSGSYGYNPKGAAWSFVGQAGISGNNSAFTSGNPAAPSGSQVGIIQGVGSASQVLSGMAAGTYRVSLQAAQRGNFQASREDFQILIDGQPIGVFTPSGTTYQALTTAPFTTTAGSHTLTIKGLNTAGGENTAFIDTLSVDLAPSVVTVVSPGFEAPALAGGTYLYAPSGTAWSYAGGAGVAANASAFTSGNPAAPDGNQVAFLQGSGSASQVITGWTAGSYRIFFQAAQRGNNGLNQQTIQILVDGVAVSSITPTDTSYQTYLTDALSLTAGSHTLSFQGLNPKGGDNTAFMDGVTVVSAAVPIGDASLEAVALTPGSYAYTPTGSTWSFTGGGGISSNNSVFTSRNPAAPSGAQVAFLQSSGSMSQTVSGWAAGTYQVSFQAAQRLLGTLNAQSIRILIDGQIVGTITPSGSAYAAYASSPFAVAAGTHVITLQGINTKGDNTAFIDAISAQVSSAAPQGLADAGFESLAQAPNGFTYAPTGSAWNFSGPSGVTANGSGFTGANPAAPAGSQVAFLQVNGSIAQTLSNIAAGTYQISFQAAQRANYQASRQNFQVLVDGQVAGTFTPSGTTYSAYATASFPLTAGSHTIVFQGLDSAGGDNTAFLDSVVIQTATS